MVTSLRPPGSGRAATCASFLRASASPTAGLVIASNVENPSDWPTVRGLDAADAQLGHALGWVCEVRNDDIIVLNPLGEGLFKAPVPEVGDAWLHQVRASESAAVYLVGPDHEGPALAVIGEAAAAGALAAASVRTSVAEGFGAMAIVGRNEPCPCGSGRKFKKCHG